MADYRLNVFTDPYGRSIIDLDDNIGLSPAEFYNLLMQRYAQLHDDYSQLDSRYALLAETLANLDNETINNNNYNYNYTQDNSDLSEFISLYKEQLKKQEEEKKKKKKQKEQIITVKNADDNSWFNTYKSSYLKNN